MDTRPVSFGINKRFVKKWFDEHECSCQWEEFIDDTNQTDNLIIQSPITRTVLGIRQLHSRTFVMRCDVDEQFKVFLANVRKACIDILRNEYHEEFPDEAFGEFVKEMPEIDDRIYPPYVMLHINNGKSCVKFPKMDEEPKLCKSKIISDDNVEQIKGTIRTKINMFFVHRIMAHTREERTICEYKYCSRLELKEVTVLPKYDERCICGIFSDDSDDEAKSQLDEPHCK